MEAERGPMKLVFFSLYETHIIGILINSHIHENASGTFSYTYIPLALVPRYQTGSATRESDTRKTSASSKRKPTCMRRGLPSMQPACRLTAARPTPRLLPTRQVGKSTQITHHHRLSWFSGNIFSNQVGRFF